MKVYNTFYNQIQGTRVRGRPKNRWMDCEWKIKNWKAQPRNRGIWRMPIMEAKAELCCSASEEEGGH